MQGEQLTAKAEQPPPPTAARMHASMVLLSSFYALHARTALIEVSLRPLSRSLPACRSVPLLNRGSMRAF